MAQQEDNSIFVDIMHAWMRSQHDLERADLDGHTALHSASGSNLLTVLQALVAAGANPTADDGWGQTPLMFASYDNHIDIVAFLLQLPAVKDTIDAISIGGDNDHDDGGPRTALSYASSRGHQPIVQLLIDAGTDPTIPAGPHSPLNRALSNNYHTVTALLRHVIAEPERVQALHSTRPAPCSGRGEQGLALPRVDVITLERHQQQQQLQRQQQQLHAQLRYFLQELQEPQHLPQLPQVQQPQHELQLLLQRRPGETHEQLWATAAFALGVSGGEKDTGLCEELYMELLGYMLPGWADKGPRA